jgi:hypothetical protein
VYSKWVLLAAGWPSLGGVLAQVPPCNGDCTVHGMASMSAARVPFAMPVRNNQRADWLTYLVVFKDGPMGRISSFTCQPVGDIVAFALPSPTTPRSAAVPSARSLPVGAQRSRIMSPFRQYAALAPRMPDV